MHILAAQEREKLSCTCTCWILHTVVADIIDIIDYIPRIGNEITQAHSNNTLRHVPSTLQQLTVISTMRILCNENGDGFLEQYSPQLGKGRLVPG